MSITNRLGLPQPFVSAVDRDAEVVPGRYRVTSLLKGVRECILERRHASEIEVDVAEMIWAIFGTAVHTILEQAQEEDHQIKEARLTDVILPGFTISGRFDLYDSKEKRITDYKTCSVWKVIYGDYTDWIRQMSLYAYLLERIGFPVTELEVVAMMKDHSKRDAKQKPGYPQFPVSVLRFPYGDREREEVKTWVETRAKDILEAETLSDDDLPLCTKEERYNSGDKFAVMKAGRKTAVRVFDAREEAEEYLIAEGCDYIEERPGEDKRCVDYCAAARFCSHWKARYG